LVTPTEFESIGNVDVATLFEYTHLSGRSMQPCEHNCVRSLHELVKNQVGLTNLIILEISLSTKELWRSKHTHEHAR